MQSCNAETCSFKLVLSVFAYPKNSVWHLIIAMKRISPQHYKIIRKSLIILLLHQLIQLMDCSEGNFIFFLYMKMKDDFLIEGNSFTQLCKFNLAAISRAVKRRFASTDDFIWSSSLAFQHAMHLWDQNCQNEISKTNSVTGVQSTHPHHTRHTIFSCLHRVFTFTVIKERKPEKFTLLSHFCFDNKQKWLVRFKNKFSLKCQ